MGYEAPSVDVIGTASDLIQNYMGPWTDGDGNAFSAPHIGTGIEEE